MAQSLDDNDSASRERFFYSPDWQLLEQRTWSEPDADPAEDDDDPSTIAQQFWGKRAIDDAVMRRIDRDPAENDGFEDTYYYITDHLRSVVAVLDHAGKLIERVRYGPYGEPTHHRPGDVNGDGVVDFFDAQVMIDLISGGAIEIDDEEYQADADINRDGIIDFYDVLIALADVTKDPVTGISDPETVANPIGYAGYVYIADFGSLGHWYARHRIFDPVMGRWITRDPAGYVDGMSLYLYAMGNPYMFVDPLGLFVWGAVCAAAEWTWTAGSRVVHNIIDAKEGASEMVSEVMLSGAYLAGAHTDAEFQRESRTIAPLASAINEVGGVEVAKQVGLSALNGVIQTVAGMASGDPNAFGDAATTVFGGGSLQMMKHSRRIMKTGADAARAAANGGPLADANFAQKTFSQAFDPRGPLAGRTVDDVAAALRSGQMNAADVSVQYIIRDGNTLMLNTRSAQALQAAGIPRAQWNAVNMTGNAAAEARLTGQLQRNGLGNQGISTVTPGRP
ncbi:MAG: hypothetical protein KF757_03925 [Phycisphaeraceae bacterium]|nr:hypothetical protein [Phycisphaeraceae bacterium]MCW5763149.1 hypothetical protein [Phycisphaeraceae bacterium]